MTVILKIKPSSESLQFAYPAEPYKSGIMQVVDKCIADNNGYCLVDIRKPKKPKTTKENALYWALCTEYAFFCGSNKEEVSDGVKWRALERGYPTEINPVSKQPMPKSIKKASTDEQAILIETLYQIASEDGYIFVSDKYDI